MKHKPEELISKLQQVDVLVSQGHSVAEAVQPVGVIQFTYYRWRKEFGGLKTLKKEDAWLNLELNCNSQAPSPITGCRVVPAVRAER